MSALNRVSENPTSNFCLWHTFFLQDVYSCNHQLWLYFFLLFLNVARSYVSKQRHLWLIFYKMRAFNLQMFFFQGIRRKRKGSSAFCLKYKKGHFVAMEIVVNFAGDIYWWKHLKVRRSIFSSQRPSGKMVSFRYFTSINPDARVGFAQFSCSCISLLPQLNFWLNNNYAANYTEKEIVI